VGLRQRAWGRRASWSAALVLAAAGGAAALTGQIPALFDKAPTTWVVIGVIDDHTRLVYGELLGIDERERARLRANGII